ncbi:hypothetical protein [Ktedonobacter racemifer]|uniref:hypothetical protein n=1 Tax=Ktedonobacter racemifer TaxID=363277 RepID=UPI00146A9AAB|nr:hypothetical protein [Ktedonobacter racemifer]
MQQTLRRDLPFCGANKNQGHQASETVAANAWSQYSLLLPEKNVSYIRRLLQNSLREALSLSILLMHANVSVEWIGYEKRLLQM